MEAKGIVLPPAPKPAANYNITCQANGNMLYISGHLPLLDDGTLMTGTAGKDGVDIEHGYKAARQCGLNIVATLKNHLGDLDRVEQIVKVCCCGTMMFVMASIEKKDSMAAPNFLSL